MYLRKFYRRSFKQVGKSEERFRELGKLDSTEKKIKIEVLTLKLATLLESDKSDENLAELIDTKIHLNFEIEKNECYWEQRARLNWLKLGNRNTAFFHKQATPRRKRNFIHKMQFDDGRETDEIKEMEGIARSYFMKLFSARRQVNCDKILSGID